MLWSALNITAKMYLVFGCSLVLAISLVFIVCLILPDRWSLCPTEASDYDPRQDAFGDECIARIPSKRAHVDKYRSTGERCLASSPLPQDAERDVKRAVVKTPPVRMSSSTTACSSDSGRPSSSGVGSSSSVISETSSSSSRRGSFALAPVPSDSEAAADQSAQHGGCSNDHRQPHIHMTVQRFVEQNKDDVESNERFTLIIENATDLPRRTYAATVDPTVIVRLERRAARAGFVSALIEAATHRASFKSPKDNELLLLDASCPVVYHCRNPNFRHVVQLDVAETAKLKECQLVLRVEDRDKLVGTSELCSCRIDFDEILELVNSTEAPVRLTRALESSRDKANERGELLLGLSFLPTSQRVTVRITQFERLPKWASSEPGLAIVRLFVLNESGRVMKKRKTAPRHWPPDGRLEFDEQFAIELDADRWQRSVLLVVLSRIIELQRAGSVRGRVPPVYEHVGHVAVGRRVAGAAEKIHWNSALQMPRRVISQWHHLV